MISLHKLLLSLLWLSIPSVLYAQQTTNGFFVDSLGQRHECLIKDKDGEYTPQTFRYQDTQGNWVDAPQGIREFGLNNGARFVRYEVDIDQAGTRGRLTTTQIPDDLSSLAQDPLYRSKEPITEKKTLLLERIVGGTASLYLYQDTNGPRFYYQQGSEQPQLLVMRAFVAPNGPERFGIVSNTRFRNQIWLAFNHPSLSKQKVNNLSYTRGSLSDYFTAYNKALGGPVEVSQRQKTKLHLQLRGGLQISTNQIRSRSADGFDVNTTLLATHYGPRIGAELEVVLPFKHGRWALLFEPTFQQYRGSRSDGKLIELPNYKDVDATSNPNVVIVNRIKLETVEHTTIELPLGIRHYSPLWGGAHQLFADAQIAAEIAVKSDFNNKRRFYFMGVGYRYKERYSLAFKYAHQKELFTGSSWANRLRTYTFVFGARIF